MKHCYFYIFRVSQSGKEWKRPVGGLVMKPKRICGDTAITDFGLAEEVASHRFHCAPGETLVVEEVVDPSHFDKIRRMHRKYERDMSEFLELMEAG